jgi:hypothetical protein
MLGKQPDLLNKNFAIGYFIPSVILLVGSYSVYIHLVDKVDISFDVLRKIQESSALIGTTLVALLSWTGGILLLAINRDIIRILEGYGVINPFRLFSKIIHIQKLSFRRLRRRKSELDKKRDNAKANGSDLCPIDRAKRREVITRLAWRFPSSEEFILPTSFGNAIRSFEVYPHDMYGVDSIPAWPRLYAVIPKDYREALDDAKALLDFWVNLWLASIIILLEYLLIAATKGLFNPSSMIIVGLLILASFASYNRATASALGWGSLVRSSFDLFLDDLRLKLGYLLPESPASQREMWTSFSRAVYYAYPESLPPRNK